MYDTSFIYALFFVFLLYVASIDESLINMPKITTKEFLNSLRFAEKAVSRERHRRLVAADLTSAQAQILMILNVEKPLSLNELAEALPTDAPPSRVVSTLVDRKLVVRHDKPEDRRHVELALTAAGKKKVSDIRRIEQALNRWATKRLQRMPVASAEKALRALAAN